MTAPINLKKKTLVVYLTDILLPHKSAFSYVNSEYRLAHTDYINHGYKHPVSRMLAASVLSYANPARFALLSPLELKLACISLRKMDEGGKSTYM